MESLGQSVSMKLPLSAVVITLWLYWLWTRRNLYRFAFNFPGCFGLPILGVFHRILSLNNFFPEISKMFQECKRYTICIWLGMHPILLTSDPNVIEMVVTNPLLLNKAKCLYEPIGKAFGGGILCCGAEKWRQRRKMINPSFGHKVLVSFLPIFQKAMNRTQKNFDALVGTGEHKICNMIHRITCGVAVETTMGKDIYEYEDKTVAEFVENIFTLAEKLSNQVILSFLSVGCFYSLCIRFQRSANWVNDFVNRLVISKLNGTLSCNSTANLQTRSKTKEELEHELLSIQKTPKIFIDQAIEIYQKQQISLHDIIAESNTLVATAFDTTASAIYSVLVMLAMHPDVQEKLYEEISNYYPDKDVKMEYEDMQHLPYLNRVINETLRLAPAAPLIGRQVVRDTQLSEELILPKDLQIIISIYHLHRRTDIWGPNADKFDPDNFLPENMSEKHPYAFIPFLKGFRNCIGWRYALFLLNVILSGILRNYRLTTSFRYEDIRFVDKASLTFLVEPGIAIYRR